MDWHKLFDFIGWALLISSIALLRISQRIIENIIHGISFVVEASIVGILISGILLFTLYKLNQDYFQGGEKRASAIMSMFFGIVILVMFGAGYLNFETAKKNAKSMEVYVVEKSKNTRYGTTYLYLEIEGRTERFNPINSEWEKVNESDSIIISVGKGVLKYDHIIAFNSN